MLVKATHVSSKYKIKIKELGRIAKEGEEFEVTPIRFEILSGANMYKAVFVRKAESQPEPMPIEELKTDKPKRKPRKKKDSVNE